MQPPARPLLTRIFVAAAVLLIGKVTLSVVIDYRHYIPPDFAADFLRGRESYFWAGYHWAFYTHLVAGPASLLLGLLLISNRFRSRWPVWHRRMGRVQGLNVLLLLAPSGLWMAWYAEGGAVSAAGLGTLSIATAACLALGWRAAVQRRFADHQLWMWRTFLLLCSAVVIRMIGGLATVTQYDAAWVYRAATWFSWLAPLGVFEVLRRIRTDSSVPAPTPELEYEPR